MISKHFKNLRIMISYCKENLVFSQTLPERKYTSLAVKGLISPCSCLLTLYLSENQKSIVQNQPHIFRTIAFRLKAYYLSTPCRRIVMLKSFILHYMGRQLPNIFLSGLQLLTSYVPMVSILHMKYLVLFASFDIF